ncbi:MAG: GTPase HflX, partial [Bdellovibrionota bacterium]
MKLEGHLRGLSPSQIREAERLFRRSVEPEQVVSLELGREIYQVSRTLGRMVGVILSREGKIEKVLIGTREILYIPDLGRYRLGRGRLRRLRLIFSDLSKGGDGRATIPSDIYTDLEKLRLDAVVSVRENGTDLSVTYAHLVGGIQVEEDPYVTEERLRYREGEFSFLELIESVEEQLIATRGHHPTTNSALIVGVYPKQQADWEESLLELQELARTADVNVVDSVVQRRTPDPRTLVGRGKIEEIMLRALRLEAELLIFDGELKPFQWRVITNSTDLKVLDRSMLILDIFAQRARSSDGRLQVELAQLKYNLPRLVEKDVGLSRLTGGIGGRGPGETKLEISRRRARDRIRDLEKRIDKLQNQRDLRRQKRKGVPLPLIAIVGYTNAGKSTLFNAITKSSELAEDKLFATLEPSQRRYVLPPTEEESLQGGYGAPVVFTDTVGFIRDLPEELRNAFRATLEELYEAHMLLHVVDSSSPYAEEQVKAVDAVHDFSIFCFETPVDYKNII